ncbi:hypothetical protein GLOIN_2v1695675 [Rhizophagus irregularis DAOM 181602=DAOM 197198]|uniref:Uncharacterized protein n=1 Tax=Rhizophagus irregularis (strain DAOM 181602 / DAOM 197198 / MUCL 43194) TaxID=747089 RepID=A0A2P4PAW2_RHIID|nr:hypothetical protein GLOIN_2v1695675 [Rhizophagus irregularis DAOM 181602=DAOM 197198]POG62495.1 hypothetical protein GLOIN_2v1695675 [Rhizophagus irregularis DAOM 181602=DAOM 197198]|eukprot:XP_025169361.1 hypothetical protein GLOIN_2v1695675 [Rhizophagus irregularis DAOM 181602=DAOM 197198]
MDTNLATLVIFFLLIVLSVLIPTVFPGCQLSPRVRWDRQNGVALEAGFIGTGLRSACDTKIFHWGTHMMMDTAHFFL